MAGRIGKAGFTTMALLAGLVPASAQQGALKPVPQATPGPVQPGGPPPGVAMPNEYQLNMMIRTAIIALNQANQTGNYTVLRDLGASSFRASNDPSRLAEIFAGLRKRQIDLSPTLFFTPKLLQQPQIDQRGLLRLAGFFPTAPEQVMFDIYYLLEGGQWRLFGIGVLMRPAAEATAALPAQGAPNQGGQNAAQSSPPAADKSTKSAAGTPAKPAPKPAATAAAKPGVENRTTTNTARIQLGAPAPAAPQAEGGARPAEQASQSEGDAATPSSGEKPQSGLFPFW